MTASWIDMQPLVIVAALYFGLALLYVRSRRRQRRQRQEAAADTAAVNQPVGQSALWQDEDAAVTMPLDLRALPHTMPLPRRRARPRTYRLPGDDVLISHASASQLDELKDPAPR